MDPFTSALCMAQHLLLAGRQDVKVIAGKDIHDSPRAGIWQVEDLVGFPLREKCESGLNIEEVGVNFIDAESIGDLEDLKTLLAESDRDDWVYITLGGMTTIAALTKQYPDEAAKIQDMIVMGTNICDEKEIYTDFMAPVQETNVAVSESLSCSNACRLLSFHTRIMFFDIDLSYSATQKLQTLFSVQKDQASICM